MDSLSFGIGVDTEKRQDFGPTVLLSRGDRGRLGDVDSASVVVLWNGPALVDEASLGLT